LFWCRYGHCSTWEVHARPSDDADLRKFITEFVGGHGSRNRDTRGIGLGLATVHSIVVDHGGEITLRNRKGGGLRATLSLPVDDMKSSAHP
jgi:signal transduction histidine kinase